MPNPGHFWGESSVSPTPSRQNPQSSLIDSTPPGPQRSFPQSQAEVPRWSQDRGPSRPNDLTPSLRRGFPISCISRPVFSVCAAQRLRSGSMALAPAPEIMLPPDRPRIQLSSGISTELLYSRTQKPFSLACLVDDERMHHREVARRIGLRSRVLPFSATLVSPDCPFPLSILGTLDSRFSDMQFLYLVMVSVVRVSAHSLAWLP